MTMMYTWEQVEKAIRHWGIADPQELQWIHEDLDKIAKEELGDPDLFTTKEGD
jgi:hypothetical protein